MTISSTQLRVHCQRKPSRRSRTCNVIAIRTTLASTFAIDIHTHGCAVRKLKNAAGNSATDPIKQTHPSRFQYLNLLFPSRKTADNSSWIVQVKHGIKSPLVRTSRQLTVWKKTFRDAEKIAVTKKEPMKRRIIFFIQIRIDPKLAVTTLAPNFNRKSSRLCRLLQCCQFTLGKDFQAMYGLQAFQR
jgi:hypothetical protein